MALLGYQAPLPPGYRPDQQTQVLNTVAGMAGAGYDLDAIYLAVQGQFPGLSFGDVSAAVELAQGQVAAAAAFGTPDVYVRPRLADIPICPGCPAGQIEVRQRVDIFDAVTGRIITSGNVSCTYSAIPDQSDLRECADAWADDIIERFYPDVPGYSVRQFVASAQRGAFFGR